MRLLISLELCNYFSFELIYCYKDVSTYTYLMIVTFNLLADFIAVTSFMSFSGS